MNTVSVDKYFMKFDCKGASMLTVFKALNHSTFIGRNNGQQWPKEEQRAKQIPQSKRDHSKTLRWWSPRQKVEESEFAGKVPFYFIF